MNNLELRDHITFQSDNQALMLDEGFDDACIGITEHTVSGDKKVYAVYDFDLLVEIIMNEWKLTQDEAMDYIGVNITATGAENYPMIFYSR